MAALARANLAAFPHAEVLQTSFEDWRPAPHSYGLVFAAQSWHWVSPEVALRQGRSRPPAERDAGAVLERHRPPRGREPGPGPRRRLRRPHPERDVADGRGRPHRGQQLGHRRARVLGPVRSGDRRAASRGARPTTPTPGWSSCPPSPTIACSTRTHRAGLFDRIRTAVDANGGQRRGRATCRSVIWPEAGAATDRSDRERASFVPVGVDVPLAGWGVRAVGAIVDARDGRHRDLRSRRRGARP